MKQHRTSAFLCLAVVLVTTALAQGEQDAAPGKAGEQRIKIEQWTRTGPLGKKPEHSDPGAPLSDQANAASWLLDPVHSDEFNGDSLDDDRWSPRHRSWRGREPSLFKQENVEVRDGVLRLWMRKDGGEPSGDRDRYHTYTSAAVQAKRKTRFGYYEARAKPMDSAGSSSFWFAGSDSGWRTEIDVFELGGKAEGHEHRYNMNLHVFYTPEEKRHWNIGGHWEAPFRLTDDFHVYGLEWGPDRVRYFVDGVEVRWVENTHWHRPLYLIFDSETMIDWLGRPADEDLPSDYQIDYVRVWRSPPTREARASAGPKAR